MSLGERLRRGETGPAIAAARDLDRGIHEGRVDAGALDGLRAAYLALLDLRGYLIRTPEEVESSIREIRDAGPGFDLYEVSAALAACDAATDCRGLPGRRRLPELKDFERPCSCSRDPDRLDR